MAKRLIIGLTGLMSSGKGTAARFLTDKYGFTGFRFSTILRDLLDRLSLEQNRHNLQELSRILRQTYGDDVLAKALAGDVRRTANQNIVVDGIRRPLDIKYLKELPGFVLVAIEAADRLRYERLTKRGENSDDAATSWEDFLKAHQADAELTIPKVMAEAEYKIDNNGSLADLHRQLDELLVKLEHGS